MKLRVAIRKDVEFLSSQGLMDYSLLIAVEDKEKVDLLQSETLVNDLDFINHSDGEMRPSMANNTQTINF